jgi:hypothetical protein
VSRLPTPGGDENTWGEILNDWISVAHNTDGTFKASQLPEPNVPDGTITPAKLSQAYIPASQKAASSGIATLDGSGQIPVAQIPVYTVNDATTTSKGIVQLAGDLAGTATAPTVPGLTQKYVKPGNGIPESDLAADIQTKLNNGASVADATTTSKGTVQLAGDLGGTAGVPTVPGLAGLTPLSHKGAAGGVATLDATTTVPTAQLPGTYAPDATSSTKGILRLTNHLGGTASSPTVPGLTAKAIEGAVLHQFSPETVTGKKTFTNPIEVPNPTNPPDTVNKDYVDDLLATNSVPDATTTSKGLIQLAGDLGGTAAAPTAPGKINLTQKAAANGVATLDGSTKLLSAQMPSSGRIQPYYNSGSLTTGIGAHRLYNDSPSAWTIVSLRASVGTPSVGASIIVDVNIDGTSIFTTQANRPTIAASSYTSAKVTNMDTTTVNAGSYMTVDIDQLGTTTLGSDLTVQIEIA